jgi:hypothetical protein
MEEIIGNDLGTISAVFLGLVLFGIGYNSFISWAERQGYTEGFISFSVVLGVVVTLGGMAILNWKGAVTALCCFAASGLPMIVGSISRYLTSRKQAQETMVEEIKR